MQYLNNWLRTTAAGNVFEQPSAKSIITAKTAIGDVLFVLAATDNFYKVQTPRGQLGFINSSVVSNKLVRTQNLNISTRLLDEPNTAAASKMQLAKNSSVDIIGSYNNFYLVKTSGELGWIVR